MFYFTLFVGNGHLNISWGHQYTCIIKEGRKTLLENDKIDQRAEVSMQDLQEIPQGGGRGQYGTDGDARRKF